MDHGRYLEVDDIHGLVSHLHHGNVDAPRMEVFRHLQADETGTHHQGVFHLAVVHQGADPVGIRNGPKGVDRRMFETGNGRFHRRSTGRQEQLVVGFIVFTACCQVFDPDVLFVGADCYNLVPGAHVDVEQFLEPFGALNDETSPLGDRIADVVGEAAVRIGDVVASFEDDDFRCFVKSFEPGCRGHAGGHAAND